MLRVDPAEDADRAGKALGVVAGVLQGLVGALQEEAVLGVHQLGLAGARSKKRGVERGPPLPARRAP